MKKFVRQFGSCDARGIHILLMEIFHEKPVTERKSFVMDTILEARMRLKTFSVKLQAMPP